MAVLIGLTLAVAVMFLHIVGFDRDRAFYPVVLIVVAHYYVLFSTVGGNVSDVQLESLYFALFSAAAVLGFRTSLWFVVAGLALHGVFDFFHQHFATGRGVPHWWPSFCLAFDLAAAAALAALLILGGSRAVEAKADQKRDRRMSQDNAVGKLPPLEEN